MHLAMLVAAQQGELPKEEWTALAGGAGAIPADSTGTGPDWLPADTRTQLQHVGNIPSCQVNVSPVCAIEHIPARSRVALIGSWKPALVPASINPSHYPS